MSKTFIIVRGLPGSGKSTFADLLAGETGQVFSTDNFWTEGRLFSPDLIAEAHQWNFSRTIQAFENGEPRVILANTSTQEWEFQHYTEEALEHGYQVHSVVVENRHGGHTIHGVPEDVVSKMEHRFEVRLNRKTKIMGEPKTFCGKVRKLMKRSNLCI